MQPDKNNNRKCHSDEVRGGIPENHMKFTLEVFRFPPMRFLESLERGVRVGLLLIFCFFLQSCNWFFYPEETNISNLESYEDYENALKGVYSILEEYMSNTAFFYPSVMGDDVYEGPSDYSLFYDDCQPLNYNYRNTSWEGLYKIIASANNIIVQYNNSRNKSVSQLVGEACFIRAYCHLRLAKIYGRVPLIDDIDVDYVISLPTFHDEYSFIEADLNTAISLLPDNRENSRVSGVTVHRGTAKALLAELYLYWGGYPVNDESKYHLAASMAEEVIDSAEYFGFELEDDFAVLWEQSGLYSNESVFSVYITGNLYTANSFHYYILADSTSFPSNYYFDNLSYWATQTNFYNNFPKNYRRDITFINDIDYTLRTVLFDDNSLPVGVEYIDTFAYINDIDTESKCLKLGFRKFYFDMDEVVDTVMVSESLLQFSIDHYGLRKVYLYRFAHTLLTYAEAATRSGNLNEKAYECLNLIRRRANHVDIYSPSKYDIQKGLSAGQFADSVIQERAWELAGEPEGRWFDQIRTGQAGGDCFFDIPDDDKTLNPNLKE
ncbi:MAG: RagB/SusD family nutrient uptake outer membrane protein [Bacteroidales bacterium]|nr:RagB/SusD family nutrient uptake outer membrane protein [Bacteroidales bacterium]